MKKLFLLAILLGLVGCGDNNQSDRTQTNTQVSTSQKTQEVEPTANNYRLATSPQTMGAIAPLAGWTVTNSSTVGASTLIEASRGSTVSAALITPNAKQVANVLKGGLAGIALSVAVDQLLGAIDWVMDPANNQISYNAIEGYRYILNGVKYTAKTPEELCDLIPAPPYAPHKMGAVYNKTYRHWTCGFTPKPELNVVHYAYDLITIRNKEKLPLETVAEQVITNADSGSLDAQVATNIAAQNILNDVEQAEPVVRNLEDNARDKDPRCKAYLTEMNEWVAELESRYAKMLEDEHNLYRDYRSLRQGHPVYGSWQGHKDRYNAIRTKLRSVITKAVLGGCSVPQYVRNWAERKPPEQPLPKE